jgi:hypothetical protein
MSERWSEAGRRSVLLCSTNSSRLVHASIEENQAAPTDIALDSSIPTGSESIRDHSVAPFPSICSITGFSPPKSCKSSSSVTRETTAAGGSALPAEECLLENERRKLSHCRKVGAESVELRTVCSSVLPRLGSCFVVT